MARSDWAALLTEPAAEYVAHTELLRFGFTPYMPQVKRRHPVRTGKYVLRHFPLFPRYILIPVNEAMSPSIRLARGVARYKPVLATEDGRPWRAPEKIIAAVKEAEAKGRFDEILHKGDQVTLAYGVLSSLTAVMENDGTNGMIEILLPLLGGAKALVSTDKVVHA